MIHNNNYFEGYVGADSLFGYSAGTGPGNPTCIKSYTLCSGASRYKI